MHNTISTTNKRCVIPKAHLLVTVSVVIFSLVSCSTAPYLEPISEFSDTLDAAESTLAAYNENVFDAIFADRMAEAIEKPSAVAPESNSCKDDAQGCSLQIGEDALVPRKPLKNALVLARAFKEYAKNLKAIASKNVADDVNASIDATKRSLLSMISQINETRLSDGDLTEEEKKKFEDHKVKVTGIAEAAGEIVKWFAGEYVESLKYNALRDSTMVANPIILDSKQLFERQIENAQKILLTQVQDLLNDAKSQLESANDKSNIKSAIERLIIVTEAYDSMLKKNRVGIFSSVSDAHSKLTHALNGSTSFYLTVSQIKHAQGQISDLAASLQKLKKAFDTSKESER